LDEAIKIHPDNASAYYYRGTAYFGRRKFKKALSDYHKAIELNPEYVNAYINRGFYYHSRNEFPKAINDYNKALDLNPMSPTASRLLAQAITDRDLYELRMSDMKRAGEMGVVTRQNRVPSAPQPQQ